MLLADPHETASKAIDFLLDPPGWALFLEILGGGILIWLDLSGRLRRRKEALPSDATASNAIPVRSNYPDSDNASKHHRESLTTTAFPPIIVPLEEQKLERPDREFVGRNVTPEYLMSFQKDDTLIQANKRMEAFSGKWIVTEGTLANIVPSLSNPAWPLMMSFERSGPIRTFVDRPLTFMFYTESWRGRLSVLRRKDELRVIGRITKVDLLGLHLTDCEFTVLPVIELPDLTQPDTPERTT